jgi:UDP-2,3-diacylglucosamine hydrolase
MKKIYFASDFHLGVPNKEASRAREQRIVAWLESIKHDAEAIYLVGDIFDMWYEYRTVVPKGYLRLLGKLAELREANIPIYAFMGNHDMWQFGYLTDELGIPVFDAPIEREFNGKRFFIGHGDGLGPGDTKYKLLKKVFRNPVCQWLFGWLHPDIGLGLANYLSSTSRKANAPKDVIFLGEKNEWLFQYCCRKLETKHIDFFIFGHRHLPLDLQLPNGKSRYINLGEWLKYDSYAVFDGTNLQLNYFK